MLYFAANRRFHPLYRTIPLIPYIACVLAEFAVTLVDAIINRALLRIFADFGTLFQTDITRVAVNRLIVGTDQLRRFRDIVCVRCRRCYRVHITASSINTDMRFHPEVAPVAFLRRMHFGVALSRSILRGTWRLNNRRVDDAPAAHHVAVRLQTRRQIVKQFLRQVMLFQQAPEFEQRRCVWRLGIAKVDTLPREHGRFINTPRSDKADYYSSGN